jgi:hypothetical protein
VIEGADEETTATDGGSAEKTLVTSCTNLEKMSFAEEDASVIGTVGT